MALSFLYPRHLLWVKTQGSPHLPEIAEMITEYERSCELCCWRTNAALAEQSSCALEQTRMKDEYQQTFCEIRESEVGVRNYMVKMEGRGQLEGRWEIFFEPCRSGRAEMLLHLQTGSLRDTRDQGSKLFLRGKWHKKNVISCIIILPAHVKELI